MATPTLTLYVDVLSPYSYLAFHVFRNSPVFKPCAITYIPVLLGGIMKECGNTGPTTIKNKREYIIKERRRWTRQFNVPFAEEMPVGWPMSTLATQRALAALELVAPEKLGDVLAALYQAFFAEKKPIAKLEEFTPIFQRVLGKEVAESVVGMSSTEEAKKRLAANTTTAVEQGAFGLPWYVATTAEGKAEGFWGFDHIKLAADHLGLEQPGPKSGTEEGWRAML